MENMKRGFSIVKGMAVSAIACIVIFTLWFQFFGGMTTRSSIQDFKAKTIGLERVVTVYDYNGGAIKTWEGKILTDSVGPKTKITFRSGKTAIVNNGIVIVEEK